jgi:hypothetical protein
MSGYFVYYQNVKKYARNLWDTRSIYRILFFIWNNIRMWIDIVIRIAEAKGFLFASYMSDKDTFKVEMWYPETI